MKHCKLLLLIATPFILNTAFAQNIKPLEVSVFSTINLPINTPEYNGVQITYNLVTRRRIDRKLECTLKDVSNAWFEYEGGISRSGMLLTSEGESLLRYCNQLEQLEGEALSAIQNTGTQKSVSVCIAGPYTIMRSRIIPSCIEVSKKFPKLLLKFEISDAADLSDRLRQGSCQLAILEEKFVSEEMVSKKLGAQQYALVASPTWKKRSLKEIIKTERIIDFDKEDNMTFDYLKSLDLYDLANKERHYCNRTSALPMMIASGLGYGVLPMDIAKLHLANGELITLNKGKMFSQNLALSWFPRHQPQKYFTDLIQACE